MAYSRYIDEIQEQIRNGFKQEAPTPSETVNNTLFYTPKQREQKQYNATMKAVAYQRNMDQINDVLRGNGNGYFLNLEEQAVLKSIKDPYGTSCNPYQKKMLMKIGMYYPDYSNDHDVEIYEELMEDDRLEAERKEYLTTEYEYMTKEAE